VQVLFVLFAVAFEAGEQIGFVAEYFMAWEVVDELLVGSSEVVKFGPGLFPAEVVYRAVLIGAEVLAGYHPWRLDRIY